MKICKIPFHYIYVDWMGKTRACPWLSGAPLGDLRDQSLPELWHSDYANTVRQSIIDGSYTFCRADVCPNLRNNRLEEIADPSLEKLTLEQPDWIHIAYDYQCNLSCPSCRTKKFIPRPEYLTAINQVYEELRPYLNNLSRLLVSGHGDPFASKHCMNLLQNLRPTKDSMTIVIETNGLLFTPKTWNRIKHLGDYTVNVSLSVDSLNAFTYSQLRRGGQLATLKENMKFMLQLRRENAINHIKANLVVQDLNFMEIPEFSQTLLDMGFDAISLEPLYDWGTFNEREFFFKNLLNPLHPQHGALMGILQEVLKNPKVTCFTGHGAKQETNYTILGRSKFSISELSEDDIIQSCVDADTTTSSLFRKEYVFVLDGSRYVGMLQYPERLKITSNEEYKTKTAGEICTETTYQAINSSELTTIFHEVADIVSKGGEVQSVYPILNNKGELIAKLLYSPSMTSN